VIVFVAVSVLVDVVVTVTDAEGLGELVFVGEYVWVGEVKTTVVIIGVADASGEGVDVLIPSRLLISLSGIFDSLLTVITGVG
jgi:hypothetical protein